MTTLTITKSVGSFEAKTHLSALLEQAGHGACIEITKRGKPMAILVAPDRLQGANPPDMTEIIARARSRRARVKASAEEIHTWRREGHRA